MKSAAALPLAAAAERLRGKPGRPRKAGTAEAPISPEACAHAAGVAPRLLDLDTAAAYLSLSTWSLRDLEASGVLRRVRVPVPHGGELRKVLFDREDLDRAIVTWKDEAR